MKKTHRIITSIQVICILVLGFLLTRIYDLYQIQKSTESVTSLVTEYNQCSNLSITKTAKCLHDYVITFYNYTKRPDTPKTLEDIKANGGDCYDYSVLYINMAKELGFNGLKYTIPVNATTAHAIARISNREGYCILDQNQEPFCVTYGKQYG